MLTMPKPPPISLTNMAVCKWFIGNPSDSGRQTPNWKCFPIHSYCNCETVIFEVSLENICSLILLIMEES